MMKPSNMRTLSAFLATVTGRPAAVGTAVGTAVASAVAAAVASAVATALAAPARAALRLAPLALALVVSGCMVGPNYQRPKTDVPASWKELPPGWTEAQPAAAASPKGDWWTVFNDPLLDEFEPLVAVSNQTVRQDYANYQQALAEVRVANAGLFPTLGLTASATRERASTGNFGSSASLSALGIGGGARINNAGSLEANASWAPDLWGQVRRQIEESAATAQASEATLANATLSEQIALATAVIDLRIADANIDLLTRTVAAYRAFLRVVANQDEAGTVAPSNLVLARTQLESAQANLISLGVARAQYEHAIAVLVGRTPESVDIAHSAQLPTLPTIPAGVPSTLLQRRPDIAAAERQMAAENAAIGVATAAYFPQISLSGLVGFTQSPLAGLLRASNYIWSLGADATQTLFDGGLRSAQVAAARASYDAAVATYRGTVLAAFQNVENDLSGLRILAQQADALDAAVRDAIRGAQIAQNEYEAGTVDYTTVASALSSQVNAQQSALNVQQQRLVTSAQLIGDLGGGWSGVLQDARHSGR